MLCNDIFPNIVKHIDWFELDNFQQVSKFCKNLVDKERKKRLKSKFPFGNCLGKVSIITEDMYLKDVFCVLNEKRIHIPKNKYSLPWVRNTIKDWFCFKNEKINITPQLFRSMICLINKRLRNNDNQLFNEIEQTFVFRFLKFGETVLEDVI